MGTAAEGPATGPGSFERLSEMAVTSELLASSEDLSEILHRLADRAREVTGAEYAAISTFDEEGVLTRFIYSGVSDEQARRLGDPPRGRGLLGHLATCDRPIRLDDLRASPHFTGWPPGHPDMTRFLGVPIRAGGRAIGSLYMARGADRPPFTAEDEVA
ncbi:MAG: GAF domain-containing protein, partial [Dehalococcoidia bacterium]|nr:GAF domain-containing protein [Dehalococcoidia bacterium]